MKGHAPDDDQNREMPLDRKESRLGTNNRQTQGAPRATNVGAESALLSIQWSLLVLVVIGGASFHTSGFTYGGVVSPPEAFYLCGRQDRDRHHCRLF